MAAATAQLIALGDIPLVKTGDDLASIVMGALERSCESLHDGDALVIAQKIFSKSEGRVVRLESVVPSDRARSLAAETNKDPRLVELILSEAREVVRARPNLIIVEHRHGFVSANAGIDMSNVEHEGTDDTVLLLPLDPDASCARLRNALRTLTGVDVPVVMNDSHGRAFRNGVVGVAIGVSGIGALVSRVGDTDLLGRRLMATEVASADELASAASALMGQAGEGRAIVIARGFPVARREGSAKELYREKRLDLFR
jgi:coenzyme F420-0:L-glutamate ligase/coenzyme F420-1:gamma-L-glutamate ligase